MKKTIFKLFMATTLIAATSSVAVAQDGRFSVGPEIGIPMGDMGDSYSLAIGASARYEHPIGDNLGLTGTVGYLSFIGKSDLPDGFSFSSIPIQAGLKYYFMDQQDGFYGMVNLGVHLSTAKVEFLGVSVSESTTDLSYAPEVGYHLANLDFGLRYQIISTEGESSSYLGLRVAYVFGE